MTRVGDGLVDVVAAVIRRPDGSFLLTQRPDGRVFQGYWEFPGGKIEPGETPQGALARELYEELGLRVGQCHNWITRIYQYPHANVRLRFMQVDEWEGEPYGREGQALSWQKPGAITVFPMLPANAPILKALSLPVFYVITCAEELGLKESLDRLEAGLLRGYRLVQLRDKKLAELDRARFASDVAERCRAAGARLVVNDDVELAERVEAQGLHLSSGKLLSMSKRPAFELCGASCHNSRELAKAVQLECDFVVLGPVKPTLSHPDSRCLGWNGFSDLLREFPLPAFALGGLCSDDLACAKVAGAHGISMMRAAWSAAESA